MRTYSQAATTPPPIGNPICCLKVAMTTAAGVFPKWVLLEPYVFRRDDDDSFPDDTVRASGTTSWGADFRIAFSLADPPSISRLYAQLPGFPGPRKGNPLQVVASHRHLTLLAITTRTPSQGLVQNFFIFGAPSSSSLRALPPCTESRYDVLGAPFPHRSNFRLLASLSLGLWCGDKGEEFVVAELALCLPAHGRTLNEAFADICWLRSSFTDDQLGRRKWGTIRAPIVSTTEDDLWKLSRWYTHAVIPFQRWLCWISYHHGILFWDVSQELPAPPISFLWFPPDSYSLASAIHTPCSGNGGVSVIDHGRLLKFVYVARSDSCPAFAPLKPGTGFTITCHTLVLGGSMSWNLDYTVTSDDLGDQLPRGLPMYPRVDIDRPEVVHFLFIEFPKPYGKMSVPSIDMNKKTVLSCNLYMDGKEPNEAEDADFIAYKCLSPTPRPFLPCEFSRFCNLSRNGQN